MVTKINEEMEKLAKFRISVEDSKTRDGVHSYQSQLAIITPVKRDYNGHSTLPRKRVMQENLYYIPVKSAELLLQHLDGLVPQVQEHA
ncbi:hypothetical protein [Desulfatitalea tepidiphila]|uniref:hypothetical protein n=1 Tax=Desulfatitalea tepidiphila TaxID=1185843 RepID=UPI00128F8156|nr:hypothetical protein [Desulfatitalea tepidiphila]